MAKAIELPAELGAIFRRSGEVRSTLLRRTRQKGYAPEQFVLLLGDTRSCNGQVAKTVARWFVATTDNVVGIALPSDRIAGMAKAFGMSASQGAELCAALAPLPLRGWVRVAIWGNAGWFVGECHAGSCGPIENVAPA